MKTFEEYQNIGDEKWARGLYAWARQNYLHAIFAYEGEESYEGREDDPDIDFEFYLRLAECHRATGDIKYALNCYERAMVKVGNDKLMQSLILSERAKMWMGTRLEERALFDIRAAKKNLAGVNDFDLVELKEMLAAEIERQVESVCRSVYGQEQSWPASEPALMPA